MATLFDRACGPMHEEFYTKALTSLARGCAEDRAMAENLAWDHRVSEVRQGTFHEYVREAASALQGRLDVEELEALALRRGLKDYFVARVRKQKVPDFQVPALNRENLINHDETGRLLDRSMLLARIVNLNGLADVFQRAKSDPTLNRLPILRTQRGKPGPDKVGKWLDGNLRRQPRTTDDEFANLKRNFVRDVLEILNQTLEHEPFEPTWATPWKDFQPHLDGGPARWSQVLGVSHNDLPDQWILLLVYSVEEADIIARPTQLDASWTGRHYPSPRPAELFKGGHSVDLRHESPAGVLLSEYIHVQVAHKIEHYDCGGCRLEKIPGPVTTDLKRARENHGILLRNVYYDTSR
jgi:hypothetical protein